MIITISTKFEAAQHWLKEWNSYSTSVIEAIIGDNYEAVRELTPLTMGSCVEYDGENYELLKIDKEEDIGVIEIDDEQVEVSLDELIQTTEQGLLPIWGTLWELENIDTTWIEENLDKVAECGIRIIEVDVDDSESLILIGIDGGGYDFYEAHWIPFYEARGLKWHDEK